MFVITPIDLSNAAEVLLSNQLLLRMDIAVCKQIVKVMMTKTNEDKNKIVETLETYESYPINSEFLLNLKETLSSDLFFTDDRYHNIFLNDIDAIKMKDDVIIVILIVIQFKSLLNL